jgi:hypothetical protein
MASGLIECFAAELTDNFLFLMKHLSFIDEKKLKSS